MTNAELKAAENQYVVFKLAKETYGININNVREIITLQSITEVPGAMEYIEGVINLRGYVIPVFNLRKKFMLPEEEQTKASRIIVVEVAGNTLGVIVDGVSEVLRIAQEAIEKPSRIVTASVNNDYIQGIAKIDEKLVILLELGKILNREEQGALEMIG